MSIKKGARVVPLEVAAHFLAHALVALIRLWLEQDLPYTAEEMDGMFKRLALPGVAAALGTGRAMSGS